MHSQKLVFLFLLVVLLSCSATEKNPAATVPLDHSFGLAIRDSVQVSADGASFWLWLQAIEDNRCPEGVNCITGGKAEALLRLENLPEPVSLCIGADCREEKKSSFVLQHNNERYNIVLEEVTPYPQTGTGGETATKRAIFKIKRATG